MFWKFNTSSPQIEALLSKEDVSLQEVMDSDDIINECRVQNKLLIDFLQKTEVMEELVTLITKEPSIVLEERTRFKYPNIACELLTCDVPVLNERLASDEVLLDKLYKFLDCDPPLNPLLASYFSKVMGALIAKKTEQNWLSYQFTCLQVIDFLKAKDTFISLLLKHIGISAVMDLMLKLMTQVEGVEMNQNILNWLDSQRVVQSLISLLNPDVDSDRHYNVAQLLCDFIRIARDNQKNSVERVDPDPLLNTLESAETVSLLLDSMFTKGERSESAIVGGIQVLLALLDNSQTGLTKFSSTQNLYGSNINDESSDRELKQKSLLGITQVIKERLKDFHDLLVDPPKQDVVVTTTGALNPPLGNTRLQVTKLFAALIASNNDELLNKFEANDTFAVLLDLFFHYQWNNFLHAQVENCLIAALRNRSASSDSDDKTNALTKHLLTKCNVIERILKAWKENDEQQSEKNGIRKGYMGHLISIMNKIVDLCNAPLGQYLKDNLPDVAKSLEEFKESTLAETNKTQESLLGGAHPYNSDDNDDYGDNAFTQSNALHQQMFFQYQMQNLTSQFIEGYSGFNDDAFNDGVDTLQNIDHRTDMHFDLTEGDLVQQQEIFKQVCAQSINTLDDADDQIFEERENTFQTVIEKNDRNETAYSSDSDEEELPTNDDNMEVDPWTSPKGEEASSSSASGASYRAGDPWTSSLNEDNANSGGGWADFNSAEFDAHLHNFSRATSINLIDGKGTVDEAARGDAKCAAGDGAKDEGTIGDAVECIEPSKNKEEASAALASSSAIDEKPAENV
ncbi:unnamed protein product [Phyllotreta striolata]|uniref:Serine/threonine-protein phosphatase 6 regulatory subunit 3 n=1 Tax=Phyllotreta striolata TaxID=444603 RepID=A0A9N9XNS9_PHYSR|nr:unnamed protein product [Phyllotreta striolata]